MKKNVAAQNMPPLQANNNRPVYPLPAAPRQPAMINHLPIFSLSTWSTQLQEDNLVHITPVHQLQRLQPAYIPASPIDEAREPPSFFQFPPILQQILLPASKQANKAQVARFATHPYPAQ